MAAKVERHAKGQTEAKDMEPDGGEHLLASAQACQRRIPSAARGCVGGPGHGRSTAGQR